MWPVYVSTGWSAIAQGALLLMLPLDAFERGGVFSGFAVPGMLAVGGALVNMPAATAVARFGHKPVMSFGLGASALGGLTLTLSTSSLWLMGAASLACGLGLGIFGLARLTYLVDSVPLTRRGRAIAPVGGLHRIGLFLGPALAGISSQTLGRGAALLAATALLALSWAVIARALPPADARAERTLKNPMTSLLRVARAHGQVLATAGVAMAALSLLRSGRLLLIPVCGAALGLEASEVGLIKSSSALVDMLLFYPAGQLMDRMGRKWAAMPCLLLMSLGVLLIGLAGDSSLLLIGGLIAGLGNGLGSGINMTLAGDFAPAESRAEFIGVWRLASDAGAALAPFLMGGVAHVLVLGAAGALTCGVGILGALIMGYSVREPLDPKARPG